MRRFTQVKRKEIAFRMNEWAEVEKRAAALSLKTGTYIKRIAVSGQIRFAVFCMFYYTANITIINYNNFVSL